MATLTTVELCNITRDACDLLRKHSLRHLLKGGRTYDAYNMAYTHCRIELDEYRQRIADSCAPWFEPQVPA